MHDAKRLVSLLNDPVYAQMTQNIPYPYTSEDAKQWIVLNQCKKDDDPSKVWCIRYGPEQILCGMIGVTDLKSEQNTAEIGYWIGKQYWGKGLATRTLRALLVDLAKRCKIETFTAHTLEGNIASAKVLQNNGFCKVGLIDSYLQKNNESLGAYFWQKVNLNADSCSFHA